jgi:ATP-binding cassette subfamily C (CFTR/MRP) protein 1
MRIGYLRVIANEDLYPIDDEMSSTTLNENAQRAWNRTDKSKSGALFWATLRASLPAFLYGIFPRLCLIGFRYAQPFLLSRTVNFASNPTDSDAVGWALTGAFGLVFLGLAVSNGSYCTSCTISTIAFHAFS